MTATADTRRLPLWRLVAGLFVLGSLVAVLVALAPVYFDNFQLQRYLGDLTRHPAPDETLRSEVLLRARQLDLPVAAGDIRIEHAAGGKVQIELGYAVQITLPLYRVDLHFHPSASQP